MQTGCKCVGVAVQAVNTVATSHPVWALFSWILSSPRSSLWLLLLGIILAPPFLLNHIYMIHVQGPWWDVCLQLTCHLSESAGFPALIPCQPVMLISIVHLTQLPTCMIYLSSCSSSCWWQWQQKTLTLARLQAHGACWLYCPCWPTLSFSYLPVCLRFSPYTLIISSLEQRLFTWCWYNALTWLTFLGMRVMQTIKWWTSVLW